MIRDGKGSHVVMREALGHHSKQVMPGKVLEVSRSVGSKGETSMKEMRQQYHLSISYLRLLNVSWAATATSLFAMITSPCLKSRDTNKDLSVDQ